MKLRGILRTVTIQTEIHTIEMEATMTTMMKLSFEANVNRSRAGKDLTTIWTTRTAQRRSSTRAPRLQRMKITASRKIEKSAKTKTSSSYLRFAWRGTS